MKIKDNNDIITLSEACKILSCHPNTLRKWDNSGFLKAIRFGARGDRRYRKSELLKRIIKNNLWYKK